MGAPRFDLTASAASDVVAGGAPPPPAPRDGGLASSSSSGGDEGGGAPPSSSSRSSDAGAPGTAEFSIGAHFGPGCAVLLTGASGYIGSLVLEKLLRSTAVGHVYLLMRPRRGAAPVERLARLLQGPLFHMIEPAEVAGRVSVVAGDIMEPGLGLSREDEAALCARVDTVIHSAADIRLDAPIRDTLVANYRGSVAMAALAARMQRLRSFVYVSTCYVNINKPPGFHVEERMYPLECGGKAVNTSGLAEELLALPVEEAEALAAKYIELWGFKNTYALGKHLAEKAVAAYAAEHSLPLAIVRPSLVSAVAAEPCPGYSGNFAGQVGGAAAFLIGLYNNNPLTAATNGDSVWDFVPGDVVAHATIATAAAAACPSARMRIAAAAGPAVTSAAAGGKKPRSPRGSETSGSDDTAMEGAGAAAAIMAGGSGGGAAAWGGGVPIVQVGSSCTYPLTFAELFNTGVVLCAQQKRPFSLALQRPKGMAPDQRFDPEVWAKGMKAATFKVKSVVKVFRMLKGRTWQKGARALEAGLATFYTVNAPKYDLRLTFKAGALLALEDCLVPDEREAFTLVWRPPPASADSAPSSAGLPPYWASQAPPGAAAGCGYGLPDAQLFAPGDTPEALRAKAAAAAAAARAGGWQLFLHNMVAFLWQTIYGRPLPRHISVPDARVRALMPHFSDAEVAAARDVRHTYVHISARR